MTRDEIRAAIFREVSEHLDRLLAAGWDPYPETSTFGRERSIHEAACAVGALEAADLAKERHS